MAGSCTLILGGARSGKSRRAAEMASQIGHRVLFVATAEALDDDMRRRIQAHRQSRPSGWRTLEAPTGVGRAIRAEIADADVVVLDCLTLLVSNVLGRCVGEYTVPSDAGAAQAEREVLAEIDDLLGCIGETSASYLLVSNEVGLGTVPGYPLARLYRDLLGRVNQILAQRADRVLLMVAGLAIDVKRLAEAGTTSTIPDE